MLFNRSKDGSASRGTKPAIASKVAKMKSELAAKCSSQPFAALETQTSPTTRACLQRRDRDALAISSAGANTAPGLHALLAALRFLAI